MLKSRFLRRPQTKPMLVLLTILILTLFVSFLIPGFWSQASIRDDAGTLNHREEDWILTTEDGSVSRSVRSREFLPLKAGAFYTLTTQLTYDGSRDPVPYAFLKTTHMFCRVLYDGEEVFRYMPEDVQKPDRAHSPGFLYKTFPLSRDSLGKTLQIELLPVLKSPIKYEVPELLCGDYQTTLRATATRDLPHMILTLMCMMMGVSALIFSAVSLSGSDYREGFNIGTFALLVSLYFLTECRTNFYFISNPYYLYFVNFTALSLMPVSFVGVMRETMPKPQKNICTGIIVVEMTFFLAEMYMHLTGIRDMKEVLPVIHAISFLEMLLMLLLFLSIRNRKKKYGLLLQATPVLLGMFIDVVIYWSHLGQGSNDAAFTTLGVILFLFAHLLIKLCIQARKLTKMQQHTIEGMATLIESRDGSTGAHVRNTGVYARMIAEEMYFRRMYPREINSEFIDMIGRMAPLHDVGKIKISDVILNKPGKFTPEEYAIMKTHAAMGGEIIGSILKQDLEPEMLQMAVNIATYHHERWDGTGYPKGLKGTEIPLCARIMAAADVFDALSSKRVYKPEMDIDQVFHEMVANEDKQFQKEIVEIVLSLRPRLEAYLKKQKKLGEKQEKSEGEA